jgi:hypothetical protein
MNRYLLDLAERTGATYLVTFLGLLTTNGFDLTDLSAVKAALVAAVPAALTVVKGSLAAFVGEPLTAALLPRDRDGRGK